ncbi:conjugal transfer protein TraG [Neoasaia chiangmaiensis NBRC 101099]|uniref:Conjugal transfer protein TraG n=1 Tax=Neoasaia chiangmaiensis TaxID=320497 RepID=A0A1U9KTD8_9PROT|nr:conjugal transfer protein TraG [Neoasaia chiangmaiensis]AQS89081.1 conjugal transfer protein TraG [Neoasaia chiangmaiensis]GBR36959.1 conjugal transfer protein TraG [Neoasaia chiangmaiensis NBRC 101099]GEN16578.1 conjugal transfer protein TraG [Neoasaia chiangmaiensis]
MDQPGARIQWRQVAVVLSVVLVSWWTATQWTAWELAFQPELGRPWFTLLHRWPVYAPPLFFWWWYEFDVYAPAVFARGAWIAGSGGVLAFAAAVALSVYRAREATRAATYGSARWATREDMRSAGLLGEDGVVLGQYRRDYLRHDGPDHVLCFAPTRSGKGVGLVIPTLLTWPGSAIVHDIKGENWQLTAGFRATFGRAVLFDPTNPDSDGYNPLLEIRRGAWEVRDAQNVADILVDPEGSLEKRNHWEKTSHALLVGAILHVLYAEDDKTLAGVANFLSDPKRPIASTLSAMMRTSHLGEAGPHPVVASAARELLNKSPNERSGVLSTAMSFLGLYRDPVVARVTGRCGWRIGDLLAGERPVTLYLTVPPSDISRTKPLIRLVLNQIGRRLTEDLQAASRRPRLLFMLDEFPALGRLDFFESALAFMAGYGIRAFLIAQSLNQSEKAYGQNNSILDNCHVRVSFATNDERTARRVSDGLGMATEVRSQKNYAGHRLSPWLGHLMVSRQESARPLLTVGEVMQLPERDEVVMVTGCPPIRARKVRYYRDRRLTVRILPPPGPGRARPEADPDDWTGQPRPPCPAPEGEADMAASSPPPREDGDEDVTTTAPGFRQERLPEMADEERMRRRAAADRRPEHEPPAGDDRRRHRAREFEDLGRIARLTALDHDDGMDLDGP